ncbi:MAG: hypothetical protein CMQ41_03250 [Gammaproteobacteria bacterium]|nr:hypothetical protein [Gammaproteobacteria bacterium]|tara:strand:- start:215 stop:424 length:210 start_codon:yes stop_codon:yes gene_type:complete
MNTLFFSLLAIISLLIFVQLGKIKASEKQLNRDDRIKWGRNKQQSFRGDRNSPDFVDKKAEKITDQSKE